MTRLVIGNLDCEVVWAGTAGRRLPEAVLARISEAALELAVFAGKGDRLWTPAPVAKEVPGVELVSGPLETLAVPDAVLAWGETEEVAKLRERARRGRKSGRRLNSGGVALVGPSGGVADALWRLHPAPELARACNDRALSFDIAQAHGWALPEARWIDSVGALERHLQRGGAAAGYQERWVVKAPLAAAGRERLRRRGATLDGEARTRAERLLQRYGRLLFEPWVDRTRDLGQCGLVGPGGVKLLPPHRQEIDGAGVVRAVEIGPLVTGDPDPAPLERAAAAAGEALLERGYRGPFGVDAYLFRDAAGASRWQPLSEINARLSFGLVARALSERRRLPRCRLTL